MSEENISVLFALFAMFFIFLAIGHGVYFNYRYQKNLDQALMGDKYYDGGFLYNYIFRMNLYGTACIFPGFVRFIPDVSRDNFEKIPRNIKCHLVINDILLIFIGFGCLVLSALLDVFL